MIDLLALFELLYTSLNRTLFLIAFFLRLYSLGNVDVGITKNFDFEGDRDNRHKLKPLPVLFRASMTSFCKRFEVFFLKRHRMDRIANYQAGSLFIGM